ncbi:hypothetical protein Taro_023196 [Colocasia esculenta]|uniref:Uncharacterized protein n=1 Tax=Colocasia esculenta TaxID=4460 RepID=A0A843VA66_COLES|nr:hypothetical protein [Colocasia esculenta]
MSRAGPELECEESDESPDNYDDDDSIVIVDGDTSSLEKRQNSGLLQAEQNSCSESHDSLPLDLMGNKNKEVPLDLLSPGSDGMHAFSTHSVSYILDDQDRSFGVVHIMKQGSLTPGRSPFIHIMKQGSLLTNKYHPAEGAEGDGAEEGGYRPAGRSCVLLTYTVSDASSRATQHIRVFVQIKEKKKV